MQFNKRRKLSFRVHLLVCMLSICLLTVQYIRVVAGSGRTCPHFFTPYLVFVPQWFCESATKLTKNSIRGFAGELVCDWWYDCKNAHQSSVMPWDISNFVKKTLMYNLGIRCHISTSGQSYTVWQQKKKLSKISAFNVRTSVTFINLSCLKNVFSSTLIQALTLLCNSYLGTILSITL